MAYLPMAWIGDTAYSLAMSLLAGAVVSCPEDPATVQRDLREIGPMVLIGPPRIWENLLTDIRMRMEDADWLKRLAVPAASSRSRERGRGGADGGRRPSTAPAGAAPRSGDRLVYAPLRDQIGLRRIRYAYSGGAALGPETLRFYRGIGVNLKQIYGITEAGGLVCVQPDGEIRSDSVGRPLAGTEITLRRGRRDPRCAARPSSSGYYRNPEATEQAAASTAGSTRATPGSSTPTGHLVVIDRAADLAQLADGTSLRAAVHREQAQVQPVHQGGRRARQRAAPTSPPSSTSTAPASGAGPSAASIPYTSYTDLCLRPEVHELIEGEVAPRERRPARGHRDPALPRAPQGARPRRRRDHPHAQAAADASSATATPT